MDIMKIEWSKERKPCEECRYNHVMADTPLGTMWITWKEWKERPLYDLEIHPYNIYKNCNDVEDGKKIAQEWFEDKILQCILHEV